MKKKLRVLIDGRKIGPNGIGVYTENIIIALAAVEEIELGVLFSTKLQNVYDLVKHNWYAHIRPIWTKTGLYSFSEYFFLAAVINKGHWQIYHSTHYTLPFGIKAKKVVSIHDIIHISHPEKWYYPFVAKLLIASAIHRSDSVIAVSEAGSLDLQKHFFLKEKNIKIIPNIFPFALKDFNTLKKEKYFLAVVSTWKPHKGVDFLIKCFTTFNKNNPEYKLILVGAGVAKAKELGLLDSYADQNAIEFKGKLSKSDLASLYAKAAAVCVASKAEGFCLPMLEAHANFCPVVHRPVPAIEELAIADFDVSASDWTEEAYIDALERVLPSIKLAESFEIKEKLEQQLNNYSPSRIAKQLIAVYKDILGLA